MVILNQIEILCLRGCNEIKGDFIKALANNSALRILMISHNVLKNMDMQNIERLQELENFSYIELSWGRAPLRRKKIYKEEIKREVKMEINKLRKREEENSIAESRFS